MNLRHRTFVGAVVAGVAVLSVTGVALTADYSTSGTTHAYEKIGNHRSGLVDDKDDDSEDVARARGLKCVFAARPECPHS